jgi:hypothetical protein
VVRYTSRRSQKPISWARPPWPVASIPPPGLLLHRLAPPGRTRCTTHRADSFPVPGQARHGPVRHGRVHRGRVARGPVRHGRVRLGPGRRGLVQDGIELGVNFVG